MPIAKDDYEYFLDLSAKPFRIFKAGYWGVEPMHWYSEDIVPDITEYLLGLENGTIGRKYATEDVYGNKLDQNGKLIAPQPSYDVDLNAVDYPIPEFIGYDNLYIDSQMTKVQGIILDSPIEPRMIRQYGYIPVPDNSKKPYQAWWVIENKKLKLNIVNAYVGNRDHHTHNIVPEYDSSNNDDEIYFHYEEYSGTLIFIVENIVEPGYFSHDLEVGDKIYISVQNGFVTNYDKRKS